MSVGAVILAGGLSTRMGKDKSALEFCGVSFLDRLALEFGDYDEFFISVDKKSNHPHIAYAMVEDIFARCGAIGGLYAALENCKSDALIVAPCDTPYFDKNMAGAMLSMLDDETDAVVALDSNGKTHALCGVYKKECRKVFKKCIEDGRFALNAALDCLNVKKYDARQDSWRLANVNTPEDFIRLRDLSLADTTGSLYDVNCLAISGWKNAGKTTLIEKLIPALANCGLKVAVIKHDGHKYTADTPGTDSYRFFEAGAYVSAVYDSEKYTVTKRDKIDEKRLLALTDGADIVLLEGAKQTGYPKLEIVRQAGNPNVMEGLTGRLAFISDIPGLPQNIPVFMPDDIEGITKFILKNYKSGELRKRYPLA